MFDSAALSPGSCPRSPFLCCPRAGPLPTFCCPLEAWFPVTALGVRSCSRYSKDPRSRHFRGTGAGGCPSQSPAGESHDPPLRKGKERLREGRGFHRELILACELGSLSRQPPALAVAHTFPKISTTTRRLDMGRSICLLKNKGPLPAREGTLASGGSVVHDPQVPEGKEGSPGGDGTRESQEPTAALTGHPWSSDSRVRLECAGGLRPRRCSPGHG